MVKTLAAACIAAMAMVSAAQADDVVSIQLRGRCREMLTSRSRLVTLTNGVIPRYLLSISSHQALFDCGGRAILIKGDGNLLRLDHCPAIELAGGGNRVDVGTPSFAVLFTGAPNTVYRMKGSTVKVTDKVVAKPGTSDGNTVVMDDNLTARSRLCPRPDQR